MTVSSDKTGKGTNSRNILGTSWMVIWEKNLKYLKAEQVSQQISIFFKPKFHNEGGDCQKNYFEVFFWQGSHMSPQKISTLTNPPSRFLPIPPRYLTNIRCWYFSLNIWVLYQQLELDWCMFDQNWAKTGPLHFQIFPIFKYFSTLKIAQNTQNDPFLAFWGAPKMVLGGAGSKF